MQISDFNGFQKLILGLNQYSNFNAKSKKIILK